METQRLLRIILRLLCNAVELLGKALFWGLSIFTLFTLFYYHIFKTFSHE